MKTLSRLSTSSLTPVRRSPWGAVASLRRRLGEGGSPTRTRTSPPPIPMNTRINHWSLKSILCAAALIAVPLSSVPALATVLISPAGDGGFESGFGGWTVVNGATDNKWFTGTAAGASVGTNAAFIGSNATTYTDGVTQAASVVDFFYMNVSFPPGETSITLTFDYKQPTGDTTFDLLRVYLVPTSTTPTAGTALSSGQISTRCSRAGARRQRSHRERSRSQQQTPA